MRIEANPWIHKARIYEPRSYPKGAVRLDMNEYPEPPPSWMIERACRAASEVNRYPTRELFTELLEAIAGYAGVGADNIALGAGGYVILQAVLEAYTRPGDTVAVPRYTYTYFKDLAIARGLRVVEIGLVEDGDEWRLSQPVPEARLLYLDNPNNPTGSLIAWRDIVMEAVDRGIVVVVDEAYYEYSGATLAGEASETSGLIVVRTMSKAFSLAGARIGYSISTPGDREVLRRVLLPYPTSTCSMTLAVEALRNPGYMRERVERVIGERERLRSRLSSMGLKAYKSHANFILVKTGVEGIVERLAMKGIIVRKTTISNDTFRATISLRRENEALVEALKDILQL